jgi:hypothetical protein
MPIRRGEEPYGEVQYEFAPEITFEGFVLDPPVFASTLGVLNAIWVEVMRILDEHAG